MAFRRLTPAGTLRAAPGLPAAVLLRGVLTFAFFAADAYVTLALQDWRGTSATESGVIVTAATLSWTAGAWVQARWIGRIAHRDGAEGWVGLAWAFGAGLAVAVAGFALAGRLNRSVPRAIDERSIDSVLVDRPRAAPDGGAPSNPG